MVILFVIDIDISRDIPKCIPIDIGIQIGILIGIPIDIDINIDVLIGINNVICISLELVDGGSIFLIIHFNITPRDLDCAF